jgi:photosystem II stability/assembly factor-like uncharacterized protein
VQKYIKMAINHNFEDFASNNSAIQFTFRYMFLLIEKRINLVLAQLNTEQKMKYHIVSLLILLLVSVKVNAQGGWYPLQSGETEHIISIQFIDAQTGYYISTSNACFRTIDGGAQWNLVETFAADISDMKFLNAATGYISSCGGNVYRTTNSGLSWNAYNTGLSSCLSSIFFLNSQTGWVTVETNSVINAVYKTLNSGVNWFLVSYVPGIERCYNIQFIDNLTGWTGGRRVNYDGSFFRTTNGGASWIETLNSTEIVEDFTFLNSQTGWVISGGDVLRSTNGGINWIGQVHVTGRFSDCFFIDVNTGWAQGLTGSAGIIYKTTTSGANWSSQTAAGSYNLLSMYFIDAQTGWTAGLLGKMYKTTCGGNQFTGVLSGEEKIPSGYLLEQNYPNPFNPVTNIKFQLPNARFVKLAVFDMLGEELETLVNEELNAGTYKADWNATDYPSGVYFYKIYTGDYTETKKMMLVK